MSNTLTFIHEFTTALEADKYKITPNQALDESGITATAYARNKNLHYVLFDLQAAIGDDLDRIGVAHMAACEWINTLYKTPKSMRLQPPNMQTVFVTAAAFTREQQEQVVETINRLDPGQGGEVRHATLVDLGRKVAVPIKDISLIGALPQQRSQTRVEKYTAQILGEPDELASGDDPLRTSARTMTLPGWAWFFMVVNALMIFLGPSIPYTLGPLISGVGFAIPVTLGMGGAIWCYRIAVRRDQPTDNRILKCVGITLGAWGILIALGLVAIRILSV
ncbi:MAG: hypothetical protein ACPGVO_01685 [Spirulinaceae cyanobacterium]